MKKFKNIFYINLIAFGFPCFNNVSAQQPISTHYFGQNAWMPYAIGSSVLNGKLDQHWADIKNSYASTIRYGGITADKNMSTNAQYISMIDSIRANGMEPIIQVPFNKNQFTAQQAANIVTYVNITKGKNVKYWIIGNEPDLGYSYTTSAQIAAYYKPFSSAMKNADPTILIIGPECAWFNQNIINGLTTPGGPDDITGKDGAGRYYLDVISFHTYPFNGTQTRADVVSKLTAANSLDANLVYLNSRIAAANTFHNRTGAASLKTAITEANINWQNSTSDNLYALGVNSFIGGQFVAEMMGIGMKNGLDFINLWSVIEGNSTALNIGYLDRSTGAKKPLYYHFKLMAENFRGNYVNGITNLLNVKSFGSQDGQQISVLILNEDLSNNYNFTVRLNTAAISGSSGLKININAGLSREYTDIINNQSTTLLLFDALGNIIEKIEYKLAGNADANLPPTVTTMSSAPIANITPAGSTSFCSGESVTLNANTGTGYTFQWKKNNSDIIGAINTFYVANASGNYSVAVTNNGQTTISASQVVTVTPLPTAIITAVGPTSFSVGDSVVLNASTGSGYIFQWEKDGLDIPGANNLTYTATQTGNYQIKITEGYCINLSSQLLITVFPAADITLSGATTFCEGGSVILNASTGTGYTYQWKKDNIDITLATNSVYIANASGSYSVAVTNNGLTTNSAVQAVTVTPSPTAIITPTGSISFSEGDSVVLNASTGTGYIFQWEKDNNIINGANNISYSATTSGNYQVEISLGLCTALSSPVYIDVIPADSNIVTGINSNIKEGGPEFEIKVFPNPSNGNFTIELNNEIFGQKNILIVIINSIGQEVYHKKISFFNGKEIIEMGKGIVPGNYILKVLDGKKIATKRILLNQ